MERDKRPLPNLARGSVILFIGIIISKSFTLFYKLLVARWLGPGDYGLLSLGLATMSIIITIGSLGLMNATTRFVSLFKAEGSPQKVKGVITSSLKISFFVSLVLAVLFFGLSDILSVWIFNNAALGSVFRALAVSLPFAAVFTVLLGGFYGFQKPLYVSSIEKIAQSIILVVLTITLLWMGYGVVGAAFAYTLSMIIVCIVALYVMEKRVFPLFRTKVKSLGMKKVILGYAWPLIPSSLAWLIFSSSGTIFLGAFRTSIEVGLYNAALPLTNLFMIFPASIGMLLIPTITQGFVEKNLEGDKRIIKTAIKWVAFVNFPIFFLILFFSKQLVLLFFGVAYRSASVVLAILSIGYMFYSLVGQAGGAMLSSRGKTKSLLVVGGLTATVNIILDFLLIPSSGIIGAALATSISFSVAAILFIYMFWKTTSFAPLSWDLVRILVSAFASISIPYALATAFFPHPTILTLLSELVFAIVFYLLFLSISGPMQEEFARVNGILRSKTAGGYHKL